SLAVQRLDVEANRAVLLGGETRGLEQAHQVIVDLAWLGRGRGLENAGERATVGRRRADFARGRRAVRGSPCGDGLGPCMWWPRRRGGRRRGPRHWRRRRGLRGWSRRGGWRWLRDGRWRCLGRGLRGWCWHRLGRGLRSWCWHRLGRGLRGRRRRHARIGLRHG